MFDNDLTSSQLYCSHLRVCFMTIQVSSPIGLLDQRFLLPLYPRQKIKFMKEVFEVLRPYCSSGKNKNQQQKKNLQTSETKV